MAFFLAVTVVMYTWPEKLTGLFFYAVSNADMALAGQLFPAAAPFYLAMALLSHQAEGAQNDDTWRGCCQAFLIAQISCVTVILVAFNPERESPWVRSSTDSRGAIGAGSDSSWRDCEASRTRSG